MRSKSKWQSWAWAPFMLFLAFSVGSAMGCKKVADTRSEPRDKPSENGTQSPSAPQRIVSMGGGVSETIAALGRLDAIVGTDSTSVYPTSLKERPKVGYYRSFSPEGIVSLRPDLVLASDGVGPKSAVSVLRQAGIAFQELADIKTLDDVLSRTQAIGDAIGRSKEARALVIKLKKEFLTLQAQHARLPKTKQKCLFIYARGAGVMLVGGRGTSVDAVIELAGLENAASSVKDFSSLSAEGLLTFQPDLILIPEKGLESVGGVDGLLAVPGVADTPAGKARRVIAMDDSRLLAMGPRTAEVARELMQAAYPDDSKH